MCAVVNSPAAAAVPNVDFQEFCLAMSRENMQPKLARVQSSHERLTFPFRERNYERDSDN